MKKIFYFSILAFLAMGMTACNDDNGNEGGGGGGSQDVDLVTGNYNVSVYTDAEGTSTEDIVLKIAGQGGAYTLENLFGIGGISLMCSYADNTLSTDGSFDPGNGEIAKVFGYYWGLSDSETGEVTQAFAMLSFIDPNGNSVDDPMLILANEQTGILEEFGSNVMLLLAPASLQDNKLVVDEESAGVAGIITTGMPLSLMGASASLSSVHPAPMTIAPVAPVKVTKVIR